MMNVECILMIVERIPIYGVRVLMNVEGVLTNVKRAL